MTGVKMLQQQAVDRNTYDIAKNMLVKGLDENIITETTGIQPEVLINIKEELKN